MRRLLGLPTLQIDFRRCSLQLRSCPSTASDLQMLDRKGMPYAAKQCSLQELQCVACHKWQDTADACNRADTETSVQHGSPLYGYIVSGVPQQRFETRLRLRDAKPQKHVILMGI